jgi:polyketide synthase PksR
VRANRELISGSTEDRLLGQLWSALGVDPNTTPSQMTLGELGLQSMFAVELQQTLEREYEMKLNINDVKNITVKQMRDFQMGNKESLKNMSKEMKALKSNLNKIRFLIPTETHIRLNSVQNGNPIYFLPPVEGIFSLQENLAKKINRPVIGLNWTQDMRNLNQMKDISKHYINLLKSLSPNGNYDIVGHSFGALILMKMLRKAPIGRAVIIDVLSNSKFEDEVISDEYFFQFIEKFIRSIFVSETIRERISRDLNKIKDIDGKMKKLSSELREFGGKGLVDKDLDEILRNTYERAKVIYNYRSKSVKKLKKFKQNLSQKFLETSGKLFIIKPFEESNESDFVERISETYFLPEKVKNFLNMTTVL